MAFKIEDKRSVSQNELLDLRNQLSVSVPNDIVVIA